MAVVVEYVKSKLLHESYSALTHISDCLFVLFFKVFSWRRSLPGDASHNLFILFFFGTALFLLWALGVIRSIGHLRPETQKCIDFCFVLLLFSFFFG